MLVEDKAKKERMAFYTDCICSIICGLIAIIGIIFFTVQSLNVNFPFFIIGLTFWIFWLGLCAYFIGLGISVHIANKNYDPEAKPKKNLRAPIVS